VAVKKQIGDQTLKGAILGVIAYVMMKLNVPEEAQAAFYPLILWGLAYVSTRVGDPELASFLKEACDDADETK
jgi:hypothetical protein